MVRLTLSFIFAITLTQVSAHVNLIYPEGGEVFDAGQVVTIEWEELIAHDTQNWDLYYSDDGGVTWQDLQLDIEPDVFSYEWTVPGEATTMGRIKVVQDNSGTDYEDTSGNFTITVATGIEPDQTAENIRIFPNPSNGYIWLAGDDFIHADKLQVLDIQGKTVAEFTPVNLPGKSDHKQFSLEGFQPGVYFLVIRSGKEKQSHKIIIR